MARATSSRITCAISAGIPVIARRPLANTKASTVSIGEQLGSPHATSRTFTITADGSRASDALIAAGISSRTHDTMFRDADGAACRAFAAPGSNMRPAFLASSREPRAARSFLMAVVYGTRDGGTRTTTTTTTTTTPRRSRSRAARPPSWSARPCCFDHHPHREAPRRAPRRRRRGGPFRAAAAAAPRPPGGGARRPGGAPRPGAAGPPRSARACR
mmetsp:Transcript_4140/g.16696  ORF Transcript_4140/g.16696 Transcript_4140/m.16696 type:complete len:216 (+) Transcript_4140:444-1091(+)